MVPSPPNEHGNGRCRSPPRNECLLLLVIISLGVVVGAWAQDPIHCRSSRKQKTFHPSSRLVASSNPWRRSDTQSRRRQDRAQYYMYQPDFSSHFLEPEEVRSDARSRLYEPDFKTRRPGVLSWTTWLVRANIAAYVCQMIFPKFTNWGLQVQELIFRGGQYHRLFTPVFLHGGLAHLAMNMYSLQQVGPDVEKLFGSGRFLVTYLAAGVAGNVLSAVRSPNPSLGASGAVFGIVGAYYVFLSRNDWLLGRSGQQITDGIAQTILGNLVIGAINPVIDNWGHLGGMVGGAAVAYYFGPRLYVTEAPSGRYIIDKPVARLPRPIESLPERVADRFRNLGRRVQVGRLTFDRVPDNMPWRRRRNPPSQRRKSQTPNRSIRPREF